MSSTLLTWGKPGLEYVLLVAGEIPATPVWLPFPTPKEDSTKITPTKGAKLEARIESGEKIASKTKKNTFVWEFDLYAVGAKPIADIDGLVEGEYAIRLTPEDDTLAGYISEKCSVSVDDTFTAKDGKLWKYTFDVLKPTTGAMLKEYTKA